MWVNSKTAYVNIVLIQQCHTVFMPSLISNNCSRGFHSPTELALKGVHLLWSYNAMHQQVLQQTPKKNGQKRTPDRECSTCIPHTTIVAAGATTNAMQNTPLPGSTPCVSYNYCVRGCYSKCCWKGRSTNLPGSALLALITPPQHQLVLQQMSFLNLNKHIPARIAPAKHQQVL